MTTNDRDSLAAKRAAADYAARLAATYRAFVAACQGIALVGCFYDMPVPERMEWQEKARKAKAELGFVDAPTGETKGRG
jgi:hypothetical protein